MTLWSKRFSQSTRGRLVGLLRRASLTVEEMATALGVTDNAVRAQLAALERDGIVRQHGFRRGSGKPSFSYHLTPEFEPVLSQAYIPLLERLLRELGKRMPQERVTQLLQDVGREWADELPPASGDFKARVAGARDLLNQLGGVTEVEEHDGRLVIRGYSCPLTMAVRENPQVCTAVEALLSRHVGTTVRERCDRGERPRCCFEFTN